MAYGNVVGYEEVPGGYQFADKGGGKWTLTGGPAEDLKRRLDESAALAPQPTAGLAERLAAQNAQAGVEASRLDADPGLMAQESRLAAQSAAQAPPAAPGQPAPSAPAATGASPGGVRSLGGGLYEKDGLVGTFRGPSAGSKGGLELRSETRQGVQDIDPEFMAAMDENRAAQAKALEEKQAAEIEQAEQAAEHASELRRIAINQEREAQAREVEVGKQVGELQQKYDKAEKAVASSKIDTGATWMEGLATVMGTVAALHNKGPNYAQDIVQKNIDRRIAAQEHEINIKRESKNDFARMLEVTKGDRRLARQALDAAYTKKAQAVFEARAATGDKALRAQHQQQALQFAEANMLKKQAMENEARGQITQAYVNRPAVAASAGGFVPASDQLATRGKLLDLKKKEMELAQGPEGDTKQASPVASERTDKIKAMAEAYVAGGKIKKKFAGKESDTDDPTFGLYDSLFEPGDRKETDSLTLELAKGAQAARGKSDKDAELAEQDVKGTGSINERKRGADVVMEKSINGIATEMSTLPAAQQVQILKTLEPEVAAAVAARLRGQ